MHWWENTCHTIIYPVDTSEILEWKITFKPNIATLILDILILVVIGFFKPILLLAAVPAFALFRLGTWRLAVWSLKKKKAKAAAAAEQLPEEEAPV